MTTIDFKQNIQDSHTIGIAGHVRPDGDCVGSTLAVYNYIKNEYPDKEVKLFLDPIPNIFKFLKKVKYNELCSYYTYQEVKNSVKEEGKDYFVSTVLYKKRPLHDYKVVLKFHNIKPSSISVYSVKHRRCTFLYNLLDKNMTFENDIYTYIDNIEDETAWSIRVYIFNR